MGTLNNDLVLTLPKMINAFNNVSLQFYWCNKFCSVENQLANIFLIKDGSKFKLIHNLKIHWWPIYAIKKIMMLCLNSVTDANGHICSFWNNELLIAIIFIIQYIFIYIYICFFIYVFLFTSDVLSLDFPFHSI